MKQMRNAAKKTKQRNLNTLMQTVDSLHVLKFGCLCMSRLVMIGVEDLKSWHVTIEIDVSSVPSNTYCVAKLLNWSNQV